MPFVRTPAVCLRKTDFSEASQVLHFFTREAGRISCIAKGSKRRRRAFPVPFDLLGIYDLVRLEKKPGTLDVVAQAERIRAFPRLAADFGRFAAACYAAEFVDAFAPEGMPVEALYDRLVEVLERLEGGTPLPDALFSFETRALRALGYFPRVRECGICRREVRPPDAYFAPRDGGAVCTGCRPRREPWFPVRRVTLEAIARFGEGDMPREPLKPPLVTELRQVLDACVRHHLERELQSARFVREALFHPAP